MWRNWKLICQEKDQLLKLLLCVTNDERILAGLQKGFPEFFTEEEQQPRIPLSAIKAWRDAEGGRFTLPGVVLEHFGIPHFIFTEDSDGYPEGSSEILGGKNIAINGDAGGGTYEELYLDWRGQRCIVAEYEQNCLLILIPEGFVDLNA